MESARLTLEEIEELIVRLDHRISIQRRVLHNIPLDHPARKSEKTMLRAMSQFALKMRTIRDAVLVQGPEGYLH
jgi:hypothetical protein